MNAKVVAAAAAEAKDKDSITVKVKHLDLVVWVLGTSAVVFFYLSAMSDTRRVFCPPETKYVSPDVCKHVITGALVPAQISKFYDNVHEATTFLYMILGVIWYCYFVGWKR